MALTTEWMRLDRGHFTSRHNGKPLEIRPSNDGMFLAICNGHEVAAGSVHSAKTKCIRMAEGKRVNRLATRNPAMKIAMAAALERAGLPSDASNAFEPPTESAQDSAGKPALSNGASCPAEQQGFRYPSNRYAVNKPSTSSEMPDATPAADTARHSDDVDLDKEAHASPDGAPEEGQVAFSLTLIGGASLDAKTIDQSIDFVRDTVATLRRHGFETTAELLFNGRMAL